MILVIRLWTEKADCALVQFPLLQEQWFEGEREDGEREDGVTEITINLGDRDDTTRAQEQFLNTSPAVKSWDVVEA